MDTKKVILKVFAEAKLTYLKAIKTIIFIQLKTLQWQLQMDMKSSKYKQAYLLLLNYVVCFILKHTFQNKVCPVPILSKVGKANTARALLMYLNESLYLWDFQVYFTLFSTQWMDIISGFPSKFRKRCLPNAYNWHGQKWYNIDYGQ